MPKTTNFQETSSQDWSLGTNWSAGAPGSGDTAIIQNLPATMTNLQIVNEQITALLTVPLTIVGGGAANPGGASFDSATTLDYYQHQHYFASLIVKGLFTNNGTVISDSGLSISIQNNGATSGKIVNNGLISLIATISTQAQSDINANAGGTFVNNGTVTIGDGNQSDTYRNIRATIGEIQGTGTVSIAGHQGFSASGYTCEFLQGVQAPLVLTVSVGQFTLDAPASGANSAASLTFKDANGIVNFADITKTAEQMPIYGFLAGDQITLGTTRVNALGYDPATDLLTLSNIAGGLTTPLAQLTFMPVDRPYTTADFALAPSADGTNTILSTIACYCPGTRILTDRGEAAIEDLTIGDRVMTQDGTAEPVTWLGHRSYAARFATGQPHLLPVRIDAGALGEGLPRRALSVSPRHALFLDGVLIPARALVNGVSIRQTRAADWPGGVHYHHVELRRHAVIFAEGAPAESYLDTGDRGMFHNPGPAAGTDPAGTFCAPVMEEGFIFEAVRRRIAPGHIAPVRIDQAAA